MSSKLPGSLVNPSQVNTVASASDSPSRGTSTAAAQPESEAGRSAALLPEGPSAVVSPAVPSLVKTQLDQTKSQTQVQGSQPLTYDASFHGPPSAERQYHDKAGCLLFVAYWLFLLFLLVLSAYKTSHQWLQHPSNAAHILCGSDLGLAQAEGYLWWPDAKNTSSSYCVEACPQAEESVCVNATSFVASEADDCVRSTNVLISAYNSTDYLGYCLPSDTTSSEWRLLHPSVNTPATLVKVMLGDSWRNWYLILGCAGIAIAMSRFLMTMLSNDPALYLAVTFIGSVAFLAFLGSIILFLGGVTHAAPASLDKLFSIAGLRIFVFVVGICFLGSAAIYGFYLLLQLGSGRLMLGIRLIRTAQAPLREISYTGGLPVVTCGWLFVLGLYAYVVGLALHAMQVQNRASQTGLVFTHWLWFVGPVHGFGMVWTAAFMLAVLRITSATLVSTWYWTVDPKGDKLEALAVPSALQEALVSHSGSLTLASLLFTLIAPVKAMTAMLPSSKCVSEGLKARLRHFNSTAYPQMALHGYSLRRSMRTASQLLQRHQRRMRDCEGAAHAAVMPGKIMVTAATSCAAVWLSQYCGAKHTFTVATVGVTTVAAYGICCAFLTMHDQAVEAMLQCFCEDCERNDGSAMHPYYMPAAFKKVILDAEKQKRGSRLFGAVKQIVRAVRHGLRRAVEPIKYAFVRIVIRLQDSSRASGYRSVKQQLSQR